MNTTKIVKEVDREAFKGVILSNKGNIKVSSHALFHVCDAQRDIYNEKGLVETLLNQTPVGVGLQRNCRYAVFYRRKKYYLRIIVEVKPSRIAYLVSWTMLWISSLSMMRWR